MAMGVHGTSTDARTRAVTRKGVRKMMLDLLSALYDWDAFRFALWHTFEALGYGDAIRTLIESVGFVVWDDYSITEAAS